MGKLTFYLLTFIVLLGVVGGLFFVTWDIPPPTVTVEKVIPDSRFSK